VRRGDWKAKALLLHEKQKEKHFVSGEGSGKSPEWRGVALEGLVVEYTKAREKSFE